MPWTNRTTLRRLGVAAVALAATGALSACTGAEPEAPAPSTTTTPAALVVDACELLPADALSALMGEELQASPLESAGWVASQCSWAGPTTGFILSVGTAASIAAFDDPAEPNASAKLQAFRTRAGDAAQEIGDVGEGGIQAPSAVAAKVDGNYLEVVKLAATDEQLVGVLRLAVENLPE